MASDILVLCPAVARINWTREFLRFSVQERNCLAILTATDASKMTSGHDTVICSYDLLQNKGVRTGLLSRQWDCLICDESHYLKGTDANRSKHVFGKGGLIHRARYVWPMSGTPAPNNPSEMWILLYVFGYTTLGYEEFLERYCVVRETPFGRSVVGGRNIPELRELLKPIMLRRSAEDVGLQLPRLNFMDVTVEPRPIPIEKQELHFPQYILQPHRFKPDIEAQGELLTTMIGKLGREDVITALPAFDDKTKLFRRYVGMTKVYSIAEMIDQELKDNQYQKIVLFAWHKAVIEELRELLTHHHAICLYGGTPPIKRDIYIRRFQNDPRTRVFIGQIKASGVAIDLSAASEIGFVESSYVPGDNAQAAMRCQAPGKKGTVHVRFFNLANTIDERIQKVLRRKAEVLTALFDEERKNEFGNEPKPATDIFE